MERSLRHRHQRPSRACQPVSDRAASSTIDAPRVAGHLEQGSATIADDMPSPYREFRSRREGMIYAMDGGLWLHRHVWKGRPMAHLVSTDRDRLLRYGQTIGIAASRLQYKPLKDPRTGIRRDAWHWDLGGPLLPPPAVDR